MILIGLTGGIATGKSTTSKILSEKYNCEIIDADVIARKALDYAQVPYQKMVSYFDKVYSQKGQGGKELILQEDGKSIDRRKLGKIVFEDAEVRNALNSATHSWVFKQIALQILKKFSILEFLLPISQRIVILDVPLLFETKIYTYITGKNVCLFVEEETQLERLMKRNPELTRQEAINRLKAQMPLKLKCEMADYVIDNNGSPDQLEQRIGEIVKKIRDNTHRFGYYFIVYLSTIVILLAFLICFWNQK